MIVGDSINLNSFNDIKLKSSFEYPSCKLGSRVWRHEPSQPPRTTRDATVFQGRESGWVPFDPDIEGEGKTESKLNQEMHEE